MHEKSFQKYLDIHSRDKSDKNDIFDVVTSCSDVASDVGVNFKNVGVLSFESSLFHLFQYTFLQTKHHRKCH